MRSIARLFGTQENYIFLVDEDEFAVHVGAGSGPRVEQARTHFPTPLDGISAGAISPGQTVYLGKRFDEPDCRFAAADADPGLYGNYARLVAAAACCGSRTVPSASLTLADPMPAF